MLSFALSQRLNRLQYIDALLNVTGYHTCSRQAHCIPFDLTNNTRISGLSGVSNQTSDGCRTASAWLFTVRRHHFTLYHCRRKLPYVEVFALPHRQLGAR
jgi:hypothetical protein